MEIDEAKLEKEIEKDLRTNPKYKDFYERYHPASIENFIESYKKRKARWLKYGEKRIEDEQNRILKYKTFAKNILWQIQQVKLFNTQCLWRAEQLNIPEITICDEFMYWGKNIENCTFLPPITEDELSLFKDYVLTDSADIQTGDWYFGIDGWQDYDEIKKTFENIDDSEFTAPEWYLYFYNHLGGAPCAYLPDIRGRKEEYYFDLCRTNSSRNKSAKTSTEPEDQRPYFTFYLDNNLSEFIDRFEDDTVKEYAKMIDDPDDDPDDDVLYDAIDILEHAESRIELISGNLSWKDALIVTARRYAKQKIHEALDGAYQSYLQRTKLGIAFERENDESDLEFYKNIIKVRKKDILIGRRLNNEPEDFNF